MRHGMRMPPKGWICWGKMPRDILPPPTVQGRSRETVSWKAVGVKSMKELQFKRWKLFLRPRVPSYTRAQGHQPQGEREHRAAPAPIPWIRAGPHTWEALGVPQDGDGDEEGGCSGPEEADPPCPHPQRVLRGDVDPVRNEAEKDTREGGGGSKRSGRARRASR